MDKDKAFSRILAFLGLILIAGSAYVIISYAGDILSAIVQFVTTNSYTKLQQCGIKPPPQFEKIKADLTSVILPFLYLGIPVILIALSLLMFGAGYYYHRAKHEDDSRKKEEMRRELSQSMERRAASHSAQHPQEKPSYAPPSKPMQRREM